ncbi:MAG TPA: MFS transporter [Acidimicrobiales bacterium]|nr:MFS transporter [Acidimicrobiales bacterium]
MGEVYGDSRAWESLAVEANPQPPGYRSWVWPPFRRLGRVQACHAIGDGMVAVALANTLFFAVPIGEARDKVALYLAITLTPFAVLAPLVGPLLDRWRGSYRIAIILSAAGRAILAVALSSRTERLTLYPLAFGLLVWSRVHSVSRAALVPEATPPGRTLMWANSWLAIVSVLGAALGAGVAAALQKLSGADVTLWTAAAVFAFGAAWSVRLPGAGGDGPRRRKAVRDYRALLTSRLTAGGIAMAASRGAVGYLTFLLAFLLRAEGQTGNGFAVAIAAAGVGGLAGSALAPTMRRVLHEPVMLYASLIAMAVAAVWASGSFTLPRAAVVSATVAFGTASGRLAFDSLLQRDAPETVRGRTVARYETMFQLCWVAGAGVATVAAAGPLIGLRVLAGICVAGLTLSVYGLRREGPAPQLTS